MGADETFERPLQLLPRQQAVNVRIRKGQRNSVEVQPDRLLSEEERASLDSQVVLGSFWCFFECGGAPQMHKHVSSSVAVPLRCTIMAHSPGHFAGQEDAMFEHQGH